MLHYVLAANSCCRNRHIDCVLQSRSATCVPNTTVHGKVIYFPNECGVDDALPAPSILCWPSAVDTI